MATTFSWRTAAAARASRRKRLRAGDVAASCGAMTLMATTRCSISSNALQDDAEAASAEHFQHLVSVPAGPASRAWWRAAGSRAGRPFRRRPVRSAVKPIRAGSPCRAPRWRPGPDRHRPPSARRRVAPGSRRPCRGLAAAPRLAGAGPDRRRRPHRGRPIAPAGPCFSRAAVKTVSSVMVPIPHLRQEGTSPLPCEIRDRIGSSAL